MIPEESSTLRMKDAAPEAIAVIDKDINYTFDDYNKGINKAASSLNVHRGELIGIQASSSYAYLCFLHAVLRAGALALPVSERFPPNKVNRICEYHGIRKLYRSSDQMDQKLAHAEVYALDSLLGSARPKDEEPESPIDTNAPSLAILTSGTSALPKAVVHSFSSLAHNARGANANMHLQAGDRWLLSLPLHHVSGLGIFFRTALAAATIVIDSGRSMPQAARIHGVTHLSVVAAQLQLLLDSWTCEGPIRSLKAVLAGGSSIPQSLVERALDVGIPLFLSYGSTEMGSQITTTAPGDSREHMKTSGKILAHREILVNSDSEILVRGQTLCKGYLSDGKVQPCTDPKGWFHTGDTGSFDCDTYLTITGRIDRMFISGGENIHPEEIESALLALPGVEAAAVVPVPNKAFGERPFAFIQMQSDKKFSANGLRSALSHALPKFKIPDTIVPWPQDCPGNGIKIDIQFLRSKAIGMANQDT